MSDPQLPPVPNHHGSPDLPASDPAAEGDVDLDPEEEDPDAAMRAAMGFSSFGASAAAQSAKRKRGWDEMRPTSRPASHSNARGGVADAGSGFGKGANAMPLGMARPRPGGENGTEQSRDMGSGNEQQRIPENAHRDHPSSVVVQMGVLSVERSVLQALAKGVVGDNGDTAYFLPTFIEDPWAKLN